MAHMWKNQQNKSVAGTTSTTLPSFVSATASSGDTELKQRDDAMSDVASSDEGD